MSSTDAFCLFVGRNRTRSSSSAYTYTNTHTRKCYTHGHRHRHTHTHTHTHKTFPSIPTQHDFSVLCSPSSSHEITPSLLVPPPRPPPAPSSSMRGVSGGASPKDTVACESWLPAEEEGREEEALDCKVAAMRLPMTRPKTTHSVSALPPRRFLPCSPPITSPAAYSPLMADPSFRNTLKQ